MAVTSSTLSDGTRFTAKWSGTPILVESQLGEGANGTVYRVRTPLGRAAMKVCATSSDVALEWALLNSLGQGAGAFPKPMLIDDGPTAAPFFYVMEWIPGPSLAKVLESGDIPLLVKATECMIEALLKLHQAGYAFCDLKPENVVVMTEGHNVSVRFVDVGGVTQFGRSVRQYTPLCDRAFFGLGSRKAEPTYDLYALILGLVTWNWKGRADDIARMEPAQRLKLLEQACQQFPVPAVSLLFDQLTAGLIQTASDLGRAFRSLPASAKQSKPVHGHSRSKHRRPRHRRRVSKVDWTEWLMWTSLCSAAVICFFAWGVVLGWLP